MNTALRDLWALQQVDVALADAQRRYRGLDAGLAEQAAFEQATALHADRSHAFHACSGDLQDADLELKSVEAKKKEFEGKLYGGRVTAFKELETMQHEIEALTRQRERLEDRILGLMDDIEVRRAEDAKASKALEEARAALEAKQSRYAADARTLATRIRDLTEQRGGAASIITASLLRRYEAIRATQHGTGVARLDGGACGACHTDLPVNSVRLARETQSMLTCDNCGRLLYAEDP